MFIKKCIFKIKMRKKFKKIFPIRSACGECSRCGKCCSNLLQLNKSDIERIKKYIDTNGIKAEEKIIVETRPNVFIESCPFLDTNNGTFINTTCKIHKIRPLVCRNFICNDKIMIDKYLSGEDIVPNELGLIDLRKTFFNNKKRTD